MHPTDRFDEAANLAAHWLAILRTQAYHLQLGELIRRQHALTATLVREPKFVHVIRVMDNRTFFTNKEDIVEEGFGIGTWSLYVDTEADNHWACAMMALSPDALEESYIERRRPNLYDVPAAWVQTGMHETIQQNFDIESWHLVKLAKYAKGNDYWLKRAVAAHLLNLLIDRREKVQQDIDVEASYHALMEKAEFDVPFREARDIAREARSVKLAIPCMMIPWRVIADRGADTKVQEAIWDYLSDPQNEFGLSKHEAADLMSVPYGTLSSRRINAAKRHSIPGQETDGQANPTEKGENENGKEQRRRKPRKQQG